MFHVERAAIYTVPRETACLVPNLSVTFTPLLGEFNLARVIAITNQKGGVGKTTTAVNLGASLAASEQRTLIIDCDPQGNTTSALGFPKDPARRTLYQALILEESLDRIILDAQVEGLDLIPSDKNLVGAAVELVNLDNREYRLRALVSSIQARYNYVLIDCPPSLDLLTLNALAAADSVLVPIQCEYLALEGVSELLDTLNAPPPHNQSVASHRRHSPNDVRRPHHTLEAGSSRPSQLFRRTGFRDRNSKKCSLGRSAKPRHASNVLRHT